MHALKALFKNSRFLLTPEEDSKKIIIANIDGQHHIFFDKCDLRTDSPVQTIINILFEKATYVSSLLPLHGCAVEVDGKAQLFLARTGTGKTTLTAYLSHKGYPYINDDCILIEMDSLSVVPNQAPIHIRPDSIRVLKRYGCAVNGTEINIEHIHRVIYTPKISVKKPLSIGSVCYLVRNESENFCTSVQPVDAVQLIMSSLASPTANDIRRLQCAIQLAHQCKLVTYADMNYVVELLRKEGHS